MQARHRNECGREREPRSYPQLPWVQREAAWVAFRLRALSHVDPPRSRTFGKFPVRFLECAACARHGAPEGVLTRAHVQPRGCERDGSGATSRRPDRRHPVPCERASGVSGKAQREDVADETGRSPASRGVRCCRGEQAPTFVSPCRLTVYGT